MKKDFITATPDSGGSGSTTVTVAARLLTRQNPHAVRAFQSLVAG